VVFLIDDGVAAAVGAHPDVARILALGGSVWADDVSLGEHGLAASELAPGVMMADLGKVTSLLFDPAVRVVWH
jgi:hypothetical protein